MAKNSKIEGMLEDRHNPTNHREANLKAGEFERKGKMCRDCSHLSPAGCTLKRKAVDWFRICAKFEEKVDGLRKEK